MFEGVFCCHSFIGGGWEVYAHQVVVFLKERDIFASDSLRNYYYRECLVFVLLRVRDISISVQNRTSSCARSYQEILETNDQQLCSSNFLFFNAVHLVFATPVCDIRKNSCQSRPRSIHSCPPPLVPPLCLPDSSVSVRRPVAQAPQERSWRQPRPL